MKTYRLDDPKQLRGIIEMMNLPESEKGSADNFRAAWSATIRRHPERLGTIYARLKIGRSARLYKCVGAAEEPLGHVNVVAARKYVVMNNIKAEGE